MTGFGQALRSAAIYLEPKTLDELRDAMARARNEGLRITLRGAGRSYGDASLNEGGVVVSTVGLAEITDWDPQTGIVEAGPGLSIETLWRKVLPDGYWPYVVPGTMFPTLGGCVAMNVHGKNHFCQGSFGDHVLEFDLLTPTGELMMCSREIHGDVFRSVIGGFGMLGVTTRIRMKLKRVHSGRLSVRGVAVSNLDQLFEEFQRRQGESDYLVGWLDGFAKGRKLGRGVIHTANYLGEGEDPKGAKTLADQALPRRFFGIPRHWMWRLLRPWVNNVGMRWVNRLKYTLSRIVDGRRGREFKQTHVAFSFLLDYIPRWRDSYGPQGFIQVQPFIPKAEAKAAFREILDLCHKAKIWPYLVVVKRHVPDEYLMSHALDGYSLAMDFRVTDKTRQRVWRLGQELGDLTVAHGGRIYFAKDCVARADQVLASYGEARLREFAGLRARLDPHGTLSSQLSRRLLPESIFPAP